MQHLDHYVMIQMMAEEALIKILPKYTYDVYIGNIVNSSNTEQFIQINNWL